MIDGSYSPHHPQEHRSLVHWSVGTSKRATTARASSDSPPHTSQEEEPFEIELVVQGSQTTQGTPTEEQQQEEDNNVDTEDEDDKEYSPLSDNKGEKLYRDADERESFGAEASIPTSRLRA
jgi:hypothetical protein